MAQSGSSGRMNDIRDELRVVNGAVQASISALHEKVNTVERALTDKIHAVSKDFVKVETNFAAFEKNVSEKLDGMPSKGQIQWVMGIVAALIITVVGSAYAVISSIPNGAP